MYHVFRNANVYVLLRSIIKRELQNAETGLTPQQVDRLTANISTSLWLTFPELHQELPY